MGVCTHIRPPSIKVNKPKKEQDFQENLWHKCLCSGSNQIPSKDDLNDYHQYLSLYKVVWNGDRTELHIYNTEKEQGEVKILDAKVFLDIYTSITQLPNGELFCYGRGITLIIDRNYGIKMLPFEKSCLMTSVLYFDNNIYWFGGDDDNGEIALARKFDLKNNRWIKIPKLPVADSSCHSVIFNKNILISGYKSRNLWLYSMEIDSFSIIPYEFADEKRKLLINVERLYLFEWDRFGSIYDSIDGYHWNIISDSVLFEGECDQMYSLCNKEKICILVGNYYYQFNLKTKAVSEQKL